MLTRKNIRSVLFTFIFLQSIVIQQPVYSDTFQPYAAYGVTRTDNLFRLANDAEAISVLGTTNKSDTFNKATVGLNIDMPISRQRLVLDVNASKLWFNHFDQLDHTAHQGRARWDWRLGNDWRGDVGYYRAHDLAPFVELQSPLLNLRTQQNTFASINYAIDARWNIDTKINRYKIDYDLSSQEVLNRTEDAAALALIYKTPAGSELGGQYKRTDANFPFRQVVVGGSVDNEYQQNELNFLGKWNLSEKTSFESRLGYTQRQHTQISARDFSGVTGRATMNWAITGKTKLITSAWREIGAVDDLTATYTLNRGISLAPTWDVTAKINVQTGYGYEWRDYRGDPGLFVSSSDLRKDKVQTFRLGLTYKPLRILQLGVLYQREHRDSNIDLAKYTLNSLTGTIRADF